MGCDIHLFVEKKHDGKWITCDTWEREDGYVGVPYDDRFYSVRNYNLFSILADVRNGHGFAGIKTGEGFVPISEPRGIPEDACKEYKEAVEQWDGDGHSHSWFTVSELMDYDWTQQSNLQGVVDIENFDEFERWKGNSGEGPSHYSGDVFGGSVRNVSNDEMRKMVKAVFDSGISGPEYTEELRRVGRNCYTLVKWQTRYYQCASEFLGETLPRLWRLGKPEDVRIVFFFDN